MAKVAVEVEGIALLEFRLTTSAGKKAGPRSPARGLLLLRSPSRRDGPFRALRAPVSLDRMSVGTEPMPVASDLGLCVFIALIARLGAWLLATRTV